MVRPERFELPAFWFVARRSIQLSYGRTWLVSTETLHRLSGFWQRRNWRFRDMHATGSVGVTADPSGSRRGSWSRWWQDKWQLLRNFKARLANKLRHGSRRKASRIVFNPEGVRGTVEAQAADAVYVFCACQCEDGGFSGLRRIAKENLHLGHRRMIARGDGGIESQPRTSNGFPGLKCENKGTHGSYRDLRKLRTSGSDQSSLPINLRRMTPLRSIM